MVANHRKVVARYADGRLVKGYTFDFGPSQPRFHVFPEPSASGPSTQVLVRDLKALFFVRDLVGNPARHDDQEFHTGEALSGVQVEVRFRDGEVIVGTADSLPADAAHGFFLVPADPESNNLRIYVVAAATRAVYPLPSASTFAIGTSSFRADRTHRDAPAGPLLPGRMLSWLTR